MTNSLTPLEQIKAALTALAIFRQAKLDATTRDMYAKRLSQEFAGDVITAIEKIQELVREEGQTALPELGVILAMTKTVEVARRNREESVREMLAARWECPKCGMAQSGHISPFDHTPRICRSQYDGKPRQKEGTTGRLTRFLLPPGHTCGEVMNQVSRMKYVKAGPDSAMDILVDA